MGDSSRKPGTPEKLPWANVVETRGRELLARTGRSLHVCIAHRQPFSEVPTIIASRSDLRRNVTPSKALTRHIAACRHLDQYPKRLSGAYRSQPLHNHEPSSRLRQQQRSSRTQGVSTPSWISWPHVQRSIDLPTQTRGSG